MSAPLLAQLPDAGNLQVRKSFPEMSWLEAPDTPESPVHAKTEAWGFQPCHQLCRATGAKGQVAQQWPVTPSCLSKETSIKPERTGSESVPSAAPRSAGWVLGWWCQEGTPSLSQGFALSPSPLAVPLILSHTGRLSEMLRTKSASGFGGFWMY